jgi:hypothetical protein
MPGTPEHPHPDVPPESNHADPPRETVREREIIVTNSGSAPERRSSGVGLLVGLVALVVLIVLAVFAVRAFTDVYDGESLDIPNEVDININDGDDEAATTS